MKNVKKNTKLTIEIVFSIIFMFLIHELGHIIMLCLFKCVDFYFVFGYPIIQIYFTGLKLLQTLIVSIAGITFQIIFAFICIITKKFSKNTKFKELCEMQIYANFLYPFFYCLEDLLFLHCGDFTTFLLIISMI